MMKRRDNVAIQRPGGFELTDRALEIANFRTNSKILDIGCGDGDTVDHLGKKGLKAEGIDMNLVKVSAAKKQFPGIAVKFGDGGFLDGYSSFTFDGIMMECTLNAVSQPEEALHEAYCVMKKGGRLIITDFYEKDPDPKQLKALAIEAVRRAGLRHSEGDCDEGTPEHFVDFRFDGAFFREPLIKQLEQEIGFKVLKFEDHSDKLEEGFERYSSALKTKNAERTRDIGYFVLVAQKPL